MILELRWFWETPPSLTVHSSRHEKLPFVAAKVKTKLMDVDFRAVVHLLLSSMEVLTVFFFFFF